MRVPLPYFLILLVPSVLVGCARFWSHPVTDYRTVTLDPSHDTEKAQKENEKALKFLDRGQIDRAEQALQRALVADVSYGPAHNNLGKLYYSQGKNYLAAWEFEYAVKLMPDRAEPANNLGLIYEKAGKWNEAVETYETARRLQPTNPEILGNLVRTRMRRGDPWPEVEPLLRELAGNDPRPEWVSWANHQLVFARASASPPPPGPELIPTPRGVPDPSSPIAVPLSLPPATSAPERTTQRPSPLSNS